MDLRKGALATPHTRLRTLRTPRHPTSPHLTSPHPTPRFPQEHHDFPQETTSGKGLLVLCSDTVRIQWIVMCCSLAAGKRDETTWALILCKQLCCAYGTQFGHYYAHNRHLCVGMLKPLAWLQDAHILLPPAHHWNHHKVAALGSHSRPPASQRTHTHTRTHTRARTRAHTYTLSPAPTATPTSPPTSRPTLHPPPVLKAPYNKNFGIVSGLSNPALNPILHPDHYQFYVILALWCFFTIFDVAIIEQFVPPVDTAPASLFSSSLFSSMSTMVNNTIEL